MRLAFAIASLVALAACANLRAADCGPDWHALEERDGMLAAQLPADLYARRCPNV